MKPTVTGTIATAVAVVSLLAACSGTVKVAQWAAPQDATYDSVYNAALAAATSNGFTVVSQDRAAGVISVRKDEYAGNKNAERRMSIRVKQTGGKIEVGATTSGSDFGVIEGTLGGAVNEQLTKQFYGQLFQELGVTDPAAQNVVVTDGR